MLDVAGAIDAMRLGAGTLYHPELFDFFAEMVLGPEEVEEPEAVQVAEAVGELADPLAEAFAALTGQTVEAAMEAPPPPKPKPKPKKGKALGALRLKRVRVRPPS